MSKTKIKMYTGLNFIGWIRVIAAGACIGTILGVILWKVIGGPTGLFLILISTFLGLIAGIFWAWSIHKKENIFTYLSKISSSPDLDPKPKTDNNEQSKNA